MSKPLSLFLRPPYGAWTVVHKYGAASGTTTTDDLRLETTGTDFIRASCAGSLSIHPPSRSVGRNPVITPLSSGAVIPDRVSLYLNMLPVVGDPLFTQRAGPIIDIVGFFYQDLDGKTLEAGLAELLDKVLLGGTFTRKEVVEHLLAGKADVNVPAGHDIAQAGLVAGSTSRRQFAISTMCLLGPYDAVMGLDWMRDFVVEGQPEVDDLLAFAPWTWPIEPTRPRADAIASTVSHTFPFPVLDKLRTDFSLTPAEWRQVGNNQKALYLKRLLVRSGLANTSPEPPFEFNDADSKNVFQLEAVAEFYANYPDPWGLAAPRSATAAAITGTRAVSNAGWVNLDGTPNLADIVPNHDLIFIEQSAHPSRTYRIIEVDTTGHRVRIEEIDDAGTAHAAIPATGSAWRIEPYQKIDLLDPAGTQATVAGSVITLDGTDDLTRIWPNRTGANDPVYDTIVLDSVTAGTPSVFRIESCDLTARTVTVTGTPSLSGASSAWHIKLRPWLIAIDPIGGRINGTAASVDPAHPDRLNLDPTVSLAEVNKDFDTIYLPTDTYQSMPLRTYRILDVNNAGHWVQIAGAPLLAAPGPWHIQAGVSGVRDGVTYTFTPAVAARGHDHFDAMLFLVFAGTVQFSMQWSTYTSRKYATGNQFRSTVRGNKAYEFFSYQSSRSTDPSMSYTACDSTTQQKPFRNYSLKVVDFGAGARPGWDQLYDGVREARFYFEATPTADILAPPAVPNSRANDGKTDIRLHHSADSGAACSSAGCLVSPRFHDLRSKLAELYDAEHVALHGTQDAEIRKLISINQNQAIDLYEGCISSGLTGGHYNNKLVGRLWIIRPDERPL